MPGLRGLRAGAIAEIETAPERWLTPDWPAPPNVRAICTTRAGGVSMAPYDELNLAWHVGDCPTDVLRNRQRLEAGIGARPVFLEQTHGTGHLNLDQPCHESLQADASSTSLAHVACTVMVADCLPVLLCDGGGRRVAVAHAGWRGLAAGVLAAAVRGIAQAEDRRPGDTAELIAWLGPCIGPQAFEVGADVRRAFRAALPSSVDLFVPTGAEKWLADLAGLARLQLRNLGVHRIHGNDGTAPWCTVGNPLRFFSHRRDGLGAGGTGRFAVCVWKVG